MCFLPYGGGVLLKLWVGVQPRPPSPCGGPDFFSGAGVSAPKALEEAVCPFLLLGARLAGWVGVWGPSPHPRGLQALSCTEPGRTEFRWPGVRIILLI